SAARSGAGTGPWSRTGSRPGSRRGCAWGGSGAAADRTARGRPRRRGRWHPYRGCPGARSARRRREPAKPARSRWRDGADDGTTCGVRKREYRVCTLLPDGFSTMTASIVARRRASSGPVAFRSHSGHVRTQQGPMKTVEVRHPLVQHKIGLLRDAALSTKAFRELVTELGTLLAYEATADLLTEAAVAQGWAGEVPVRRIAGAKITLVPILRAGLGMLPGVLALIPAAKVSVVGLQRDERTLQP